MLRLSLQTPRNQPQEVLPSLSPAGSTYLTRLAWGANCCPYNVLICEAKRNRSLMRAWALQPYCTVWAVAPDPEYLYGLARLPEFNLDKRTCLPIGLAEALEILDNSQLTFGVSYVSAEDDGLFDYMQWAFALTNPGGIMLALAPQDVIKGPVRRWVNEVWADVIPLSNSYLTPDSRNRRYVVVRATRIGDNL